MISAQREKYGLRIPTRFMALQGRGYHPPLTGSQSKGIEIFVLRKINGGKISYIGDDRASLIPK